MYMYSEFMEKNKKVFKRRTVNSSLRKHKEAPPTPPASSTVFTRSKILNEKETLNWQENCGCVMAGSRRMVA